MSNDCGSGPMSLILSAVFLVFTMFQSSVRRIVETTRRCLFHFERIDGVVTPSCIDRSAFLGRWLRSGQTLGAQAYQQIRTFAKHSATQRIARLRRSCKLLSCGNLDGVMLPDTLSISSPHRERDRS